MEKKNKFVIKFFIIFIIFIFIMFYNSYHLKIVKKKESYYYYNIINSMENFDMKTAKYFAKKILFYKTGDIYYDISCFLLYNFERDSKKISLYKFLILNNKKSIFKKLVD